MSALGVLGHTQYRMSEQPSRIDDLTRFEVEKVHESVVRCEEDDSVAGGGLQIGSARILQEVAPHL